MRFQSALFAIVVLAASIVIANDNLDELKAIQKVELLGGHVWRDKKLPEGPVIEVDLENRKRFTEKHFHLLKSFPKLKLLNLARMTITDAGVAEIGELKCLTELFLCDGHITPEALTALNRSLPKTRINVIGPETFSVEGESVEPPMGMVVVALLRSFRFDSDNVTIMDLSHSAIEDDDLKELRKIKYLTALNLTNTRITNARIIDIGDLKTLSKLTLSKTSITDEGLKEIATLNKLTELDLGGTKITNCGLKQLKDLKSLKQLGLHATAITDEGMREIDKLASLQTLDLSATKITDVGLKEIRDVKGLSQLNVARTKITDAGVNELKKALPSLNIIR